MKDKHVSVAILIVCYNGVDYIPACVQSIQAADLNRIDCTVWILDNASTDGSRELLRELELQDSHAVSRVCVEYSDKNLGFAGANNRLWECVQQQSPETEYLFLLNQDTEVDRSFLSSAIEYLQQTPAAGCVQSLLLLDPQRDRINTRGNVSHYLGFGLMTGYLDDASSTPESGEIGYPSGAATFISADVVRDIGLFQDEMFMYLEDADLGWKLRQLGRPAHLCAASRVYHKYTFNEGFRFYYYLERNRFWLVLTYYKFPTLVLLAPAMLFMETGQLLFSVAKGLLEQKMWTYAFFFKPQNLALLMRLRREAAGRRTISDRKFLRSMSGTIETPLLKSRLLDYVANPVLALYLRVIRAVVFW